jgi:hypothetical protein
MGTTFTVNVTNKTGVSLTVLSGDTSVQLNSSHSFYHEFGKPLTIRGNGGHKYAARVKSLHVYDLDFKETETQSEWVLTVGRPVVAAAANDGGAGNSTVNVTIDGDD